MSLRFIIGSAGAGKTQLCIEELAAACTQQPLGSRIIYILPQQATFLHEKMLADACPGGGFCRVEVSSFTRLIQRVYRHSGADLPPSLSESGKLLLMHAVVAGRSSELNVFSAVCHSSGFDAQMVSIAEEMQSYGVTPEQVLAVAEYLQEKNSNSRLAAKLQEIALLYADYARIVTEGYSSHAQRLHFLAQYIRAQDWQHTQIYIDGYDEFTPAELEVVAAMVAGCQRVNVCLCMDTALTKRRVREEEVFYTSWQTYHALNHVAQQEQIEIEPLCLLDGSKGRFAQNPDLRSVEHVFSGHREAAKEHVPQGLQLSCAVDKRSELLAAGREIVRLVREEGLRYRDISLIFRDANDYDHLLAEVFESLDIPYFVDSKKSLFYHPLVEMLRCALELWAYRPHYRHIMRLAKNVFSPLSAKEADVLDNYCLAHGVKFYHWNNDPWSFPLLDDENEETLSQVNELRERLFIAVQDMIALPVDAVSAAELNTALNAFMEKIAAVDILQQLQEQAVEQGHSELASSYAQVWDILQNFFDESQLLLGDTCFDAAQLQELYDAALRGLTFSTIPPGLDQILISSLERSRLPRLKAAMVLGCNDGTLPRRVAMDGLLRDDERVLLAEHGVMLAPGSVQRQFRENYISYLAFSRCGERLYVSYSLHDDEGHALRPSMLVRQLHDLFPKLIATSAESVDVQHLVGGAMDMEQMAVALRRDKDNALWQAVYAFYKDDPEYASWLQQLRQGWLFRPEQRSLSQSRSAQLYGNVLHSSVSQLERYRSCPFAHFASYGLRLRPRREYVLTAAARGDIFHHVMAEVGRAIAEKNISWDVVNEQLAELLVEQAMADLLPQFLSGVMHSSARYSYLEKRIRNSLVAAVLLTAEHMKRGQFVPVAYELPFGRGEDGLPSFRIPIDDNRYLLLSGQIDRIDMAESADGQTAFFRIIDYKTGNVSLDKNDVAAGLQLQLLVYLQIVLANVGNFTLRQGQPAGVFYSSLRDNIELFKGDKLPQADPGLRLNGLAVADREAVLLADPQINGHSQLLPVGYNPKQDKFYSSSAAVSNGELQHLQEQLIDTIKETATAMLDGLVKVWPVADAKRNICEYCDYRSMCGLDRSMLPEREKSEAMRKEIKEDE